MLPSGTAPCVLQGQERREESDAVALATMVGPVPPASAPTVAAGKGKRPLRGAAATAGASKHRPEDSSSNSVMFGGKKYVYSSGPKTQAELGEDAFVLRLKSIKVGDIVK